MIVRKLRAAEGYRANLVRAVAFEFDFDYQKEKEAALAQDLEENPSTVCWGAFGDDEKTLMGSLLVHSMTVRFDGGRAPLGGIGGVATLPPYRRGGVIRACFAEAFREMYARGDVFSFLYPFSTAYYRRFGYEVGPAQDTWTLQLQAIRARDAGGRIEQILPGDSTAPLLGVYRRFCGDCNLSAERDVYDEKLEKENLLSQRRYIYVWRDEAGDARAFMVCSKNEEEGTLECTHTFALRNGLLFLDALALEGLMFFVKSAFSSDYKSIRFTLPAGIPVAPVIGEANHVRCERRFNGMLRVISAEGALRLCRCVGSGSLCVAVEDPQIPENTDSWKIVFAPGRENQVERTGEAPDITLPIQAFSALICGARGARDLPWMPEARIHRADAPFDQVFYEKKCCMMNLF